MRFDSLMGRLVRLPLRLIPGEVVIRIRSGLNAGLRWRVGSATHGCWLGTTRQMCRGLLPTLVHPGMVCYDVGANAGFYTLALARLTGPTGRVFAFEPLGGNTWNLLDHVRLNNLAQVTVTQTAISDSDGLAGFDMHASNAMGKIAPGSPSSYQVPTMRLDTLIERPGIPAPDFIKMDIEGAELAALRGASGLLTTHHPTLVIAFHGEEILAACLELLITHGYMIRDLAGHTLLPGSHCVGEAIALHPSRAELSVIP